MEIKRRSFQGVLNILSFNRHFYVAGFILLALIIVSKYIFNWPDSLYLLVVLAFIYGLTMPLFVSAYVYDFSGFYNFDWLKKMKIEDTKDKFNLNINAGFDETSFIIDSILPNSKLQVYDFYNGKQHTEPAIIRATPPRGRPPPGARRGVVSGPAPAQSHTGCFPPVLQGPRGGASVPFGRLASPDTSGLAVARTPAPDGASGASAA